MINPEIVKLLTLLSHNDKKSFTQKTLKLTEEVGELAKVVLPYENAHSTNHRFVTENKILEELCDVFLVNMSMIVTKFTIDEFNEMLYEKLTKWQTLQVNEVNYYTKDIPYEIHITVSTSDIQQFKDDCKEINVKPIVLDLINNQNTISDVMTSSIVVGDNNTAIQSMKSISNFFKTKNYTVIREKIETVPYHPAAPNKLNPKMPDNCYFESHLNVKTSVDLFEKLKLIAYNHNAHVSQNVFKKFDDGTCIIMVTLRYNNLIIEDFKIKLQNLIDSIAKCNEFILMKSIVEFSIYDTKIQHDSQWVNK